MKQRITRRDFLNGAAATLATGAALSPRNLLALDEGPSGSMAGGRPSDYYPPSLTGMRGSHKGSFEVAHALAWGGQKPTEYTPLKEEYDLIIVGAGISGLTAAYLYQKEAGPEARILILENHDDFGGHAKRNEFESGGQMLLGVGGSLNLEQDEFSETVNSVMSDLGVDLEKLDAARDQDFVLAQPDSNYGYFLNAQQYGRNRIVTARWQNTWWAQDDYEENIKKLGLPPLQQKRLSQLIGGEKDLLGDLSLLETKEYIETTSYEEFLTERAGLDLATAGLFSPLNQLIWGLGLENISVSEALMGGSPGLRSIGYTGQIANKIISSLASGYRSPLFADGNASIARLLVRKINPEVAPGNTMDDIMEARFDYSRLDQADSPVRIRLNSTVVNLTNVDDQVEVSYVEDGHAYMVRGKKCIFAGYNKMIPYLVSEVGDEQKESLNYGVKVPLVMANVLIRDIKPIRDQGVSGFLCPGSFYCAVAQAPPVSLGSYNGKPEDGEPGVLWMSHAPAPRNDGTQTGRDLLLLGRHRIYRTSFSEYESEIKSQLDTMFGNAGFKSERDIEAITVNRWPHGYAYEYMELYDPDWEEGQAPHEKGRKAIGNISIANSDAEANAYLHSAIDAAARAVKEVQ